MSETDTESPGLGRYFSYPSAESGKDETYDLLLCLSGILDLNGYEYSKDGDALTLENYLELRPECVRMSQLENGLSLTTVIHFKHPELIPEGRYEFQHGNGTTVNEAIGLAFQQWVKDELPVLIESITLQESACQMLALPFPDKDIQRVFVFGPVTHYFEKEIEIQEEHPFCPCCLFTNSYDCFRPFIEKDKLFTMRLFVSRDAAGDAAADCRINGEDFPEGREALIAYAKTWPDRGFEFRKQFLILRSRQAEEITSSDDKDSE